MHTSDKGETAEARADRIEVYLRGGAKEIGRAELLALIRTRDAAVEACVTAHTELLTFEPYLTEPWQSNIVALRAMQRKALNLAAAEWSGGE